MRAIKQNWVLDFSKPRVNGAFCGASVIFTEIPLILCVGVPDKLARVSILAGRGAVFLKFYAASYMCGGSHTFADLNSDEHIFLCRIKIVVLSDYLALIKLWAISLYLPVSKKKKKVIYMQWKSTGDGM